jgi:uncharacterized protein YbcI
MKNKYIVVMQDNFTGAEQTVIRTKTEVRAMKKFITFTIKAVYKVGERVCKY